MKHILISVILSINFLLANEVQLFNTIKQVNSNDYSLNINTIKTLSDINTLEIFIDNNTFSFNATSYQRNTNGTIRWIGKTPENDGTLSLTILNNTIRGNIVLANQRYIIVPILNSKNFYKIQKENTTYVSKTCQNDMLKLKTPSSKQKSTSVTTPATSFSTTINTELNVLILYTQEFANYYGTNTTLTIQYYLDVANEIYKNSKTNVTLNLVYSELTTQSNLSESNSIFNALSNLQSDKSIKALKRKYKADFVTTFRRYKSTSTCGLGYILSSFDTKDYFYSIVEVKSSNEGGYYCPDDTLAHELGHNFGCAHDRSNTTYGGIKSYSYGYDVSNLFGTVMSYNAPDIPLFSNPSLEYNGVPIGIIAGQNGESDNALTIRETKDYIKINESLENTDSLSQDNQIIGILDDINDRDAYTFNLAGEVTFTLSQENTPFYLHIYDQNGFLIHANKNSFTYTLNPGIYSIITSLVNIDSGYYYTGENIPYTVTLSTINGSFSLIDFQVERESFVKRFYQNILDREADIGGLSYWTAILENESATKVALGFFHSNEFINLNLDNNDFINILYYTLFDRAPDITGKDGWMSQLSSGVNRDEVLYGFFNSQEFKNLADRFNVTAIRPIDQIEGINGYVNRFYSLVLNREADIDGFNTWTSALANKTKRGGDIAKGFFNSQEYIQRNLDDVTFIDICYRAFFAREADSVGKTSWLQVLANGGSKDNVLDGFINSLEFANLTTKYNIEP